MQPETIAQHEQEFESSSSRTVGEVKAASSATTGIPPTNGESKTTTSSSNTTATITTANNPVNAQFPPPKTDKPRPHVCGTCGRSFARLEHLKRHERSHTKEKPFECPECSRCFARRDLLLRHQQKLHMTNPTSSRPRNARRESVSGASLAGGPRVRKNSTVNSNPAGFGHSRPRANTISHIDLAALGLVDSMQPTLSRVNSLGVYPSENEMDLSGMPLNMDFRSMHGQFGHHDGLNGLPKLNMSAVSTTDMTNSLRTAPPMASFEAATGFNIDQLFSPGTTVNPAQLHFGGDLPPSHNQFSHYDGFVNQHAMIPEGDDFAWMRNWNMHLGPGGADAHEQAIDESSPSRMSSGDSPVEYETGMSSSAPALNQPPSNYNWLQPDLSQPNAHPNPFHLDALGSGLANIDQSILQDQTPTADLFFPQAMLQQNTHPIKQSPLGMQASGPNFFATPSNSNLSSDSPSMSSSSVNGNARQSSVATASTDSITDSTRQALLSSLAQPSVFGHNHRKYPQPNVSSPMSPSANNQKSLLGFNLPSTADIRRYVDAFFRYAHPHLPVTHVPTLIFDAHEYSGSLGPGASGNAGINGGGGCLVLAMAAIGALYEYEHTVSKELFEAGKKMIALYLEERRRADMSAAVNGIGKDGSVRDTPLWLVQAMLLNVIYGHQCGDRTSADIASGHCAALVSLARAADLALPPHVLSPTDSGTADKADVEMGDGGHVNTNRSSARGATETDLQQQWLDWVITEKRKRTLFAIFIISSLLTNAYNQTPTIMNSEILLDLPCEEELWSAESAQEWHRRGGLARVEAQSLSFAGALSALLTANQRQNTSGKQHGIFGTNGRAFPEDDLKPSTFGCLVLINALHNYIWETRSRHHGRQWTAQETESMFTHIEPALNAWQAAWKANDHHRLERPNPFGLGALSADSIPLLDMAFVRLFVNLGGAKEAFWARDFDRMASELARGPDMAQNTNIIVEGDSQKELDDYGAGIQQIYPSTDVNPSSHREKHLRKAAFYAADSLTIACSYNLTYADMTTAHELPIQSSMCFFDCSQVLAEWVCTVQERVGRYLGVLGRDEVDWTQVPAIMLLETEDVELLKKIERIVQMLEEKRFQQESLLPTDLSNMNGGVAMPMQGSHHGVRLDSCGYGSKVLRAVAAMLEKAVVWPVTHVMAKAITTQATHMDLRTEASLT